MIQEIFRIGDFAISPFGLMLVAALFAAYWQLQRGMAQRGIGTEDDASSIVFTCGLVGILGGKVYYAILMGDVSSILSRAGIVWYGCFFGGLLAFFWVLRRRQLPMAQTFDAVGPSLALGYGVGRVGCFLVGDDYGVPTDLPWGMTFPVGLPATTAGNLRHIFGIEVDAAIPNSELVAVHPTQLYETLAGFAIWGFALYLGRRQLAPGRLFAIVLSLLAVERFLVEFIRAKDDRFFGVVTLAQVISLVLLTCIAVWWLRSRGKQGGAEAAA